MNARPVLRCLAPALPLLLMFACKSAGTGDPAPPAGSGSPAAAEPTAEATPPSALASTAHQATPTVTAAGQLQGALGKRVHLVGRADNAKISAVVLVGAAPIYCLGVDSWPDAVRGKLVRATGRLTRTDRYKVRVDDAGAISQGSAGGDLVLQGCSFKVEN